ncbi:MAG TPA: hypothetical protein ENN12_02825 [Epsilonproteobacteria bacterium]|nr:hypothetical protein [Campylobacterota bacterium]
MKFLSINGTLNTQEIAVDCIDINKLESIDIKNYNFIVIHGGDGAIRRTVSALSTEERLPPFILNPTGSFNILAKYYKISNPNKIITNLTHGKPPKIANHQTYTLNKHLFLFSAGNIFDAQHIAIAESLRFGWLKNGWVKYALAFIFLLPMHIALLPWFLTSKKHFFIFTPLAKIGNFANIYTKPHPMNIDLPSSYNLLELDGDILTVSDTNVSINLAKNIDIVIDA